MAMRKISVDGFEPVDRVVVGLPDLEFVRIADLVIDDRYQRQIETRGKKNVRKIADNFEWAKFSPLMVARRDGGRFAIIDGQHRAHAAALCGIKEVPALVSQMSISEEASSFSWINGSVTKLTANQIFKAALAAFEPWAVQCDAVVARAGCRLMPYNANAASKVGGQVFCIGLVRSIVEAGDAQHLAAVLEGTVNSDGGDDPRNFGAIMLGVLTSAAKSEGVTSGDAMADFLARVSMLGVEDSVRSLLRLPEHRGGSFNALFTKSVTVLLKDHLSKIGRAA